MISKEVMEKLRESIGREVIVEDVWNSVPYTQKSKLEAVEDFVSIETENTGIVFIGAGDAIKKIIDAESGEILYENFLIADDYDLRSDRAINQMEALTFGKEIAANHRRESEERKRKWEQRQSTIKC